MRRMLVILALENTTTREKGYISFRYFSKDGISMALWKNASVNRILTVEGVCFISISGALVGNVLSPCGEKANNISKISKTRARELSKG